MSISFPGLQDDAVNTILQLIMTTPYIKAVDIRRNSFSPEGLNKFCEQVRGKCYGKFSYK
jgi:hypothetical protein